MTRPETAITYDEVPYRSGASTLSHPAHLATVATLLGLPTPPVERARVLELGCGDGVNLIPMADGLREGRFVGIDLSERHIAVGQAQIEALGLSNIELRQQDLMDYTAPEGGFDYVVAHGLYSWVPAPVRERILEICHLCLAPEGIAYISYNTLPGWHVHGVVRDFMRYRTRKLEAPEERINEALASLQLLADAPGEKSDTMVRFVAAYAAHFKRMQEELGVYRDSAMLHDSLGEVNDPIYFSQFAEHAERHGLQFLSEADVQQSIPDLPPKVAERVFSSVESVIELEQQVDFLRMRMFRQTLLCRQGVEVSRKLVASRLDRLCVRADLAAAAERPDLAGTTAERFIAQDGRALTTNHPVSKAALAHLGALWPRAVPFPALVEAACAKLGLSPTEEERRRHAEVLASNLMRAYFQQGSLVALHGHAPTLVATAGERPVARPVCRIEARRGTEVTNHYHEGVRLDETSRQIALLLDGQLDRDGLLQHLTDLAVTGKLRVERNGQRVDKADEVRPLVEKELERVLYFLARASILQG